MSIRVLRRLERRFVRAYLRWGKQKRLPASVNVEPTNICNLACPVCPHGAARFGMIPPLKRSRGYMSLDTFNNVLKSCRPYVRNMALYLHGEPFLNQDLAEMSRRAKNDNILVTIFTNGLLLSEDRLAKVLSTEPKSINISMDIISRSGYKRYKGEDLFHKACEQMYMAASFFSKSAFKTKLILRAIYNGESRKTVVSFLDRWLSTPGIHGIQITHAFPWPRRKDADILCNRITANKDIECPQVWNALNICWDGTVTPCSFDYDAEYSIGNIHENSLEKILNSPSARHFRRMHILGRRERIPLCNHCLFPRFHIDIATVYRAQYARMNSDKKEDLLGRITSLKFSPDKDFPDYYFVSHKNSFTKVSAE